MSDHRWQPLSLFAVFVACGCGGSIDASGEQAVSAAQALIATVPARIEAETYESFYDSTRDVNFGAYVSECDRKDGVDLDRSDDPNGGSCVIGWTTAGEWLRYEIDVPSFQTVEITARIASNLVDRRFHIDLDGSSLGEQTLPSDTTWEYTNLTYPSVVLTAGRHVLDFTFDSDSIDLNYIDVTPSATQVSAIPRVETLLPAVGAVASSLQKSAFSASLVTDGNPTTRWSSRFSDPQWIYVDLGKTQTVSRVLLNWELAASQSYEIGVSESSNGPWQVVYATTAGDGGLDDISFPAVAARYVRLYSKTRRSQFGVSLYDFDVYGELTPDPNCTANIAATADDGANVPTGTLGLENPEGPPQPAPLLTPSWVAPDGIGCSLQCFNGSVLDGNTLAATANPTYVAGSVSIYVKDSIGRWTLQAKLYNPELGPSVVDPSFGQSLALSGDTLLVSSTDKVYVFERSGATWALQQTLPVSLTYGGKLRLDRGTALITTATDVRVFQRGPAGFYRLQAVFQRAPGAAPPDSLGGGFGGQMALAGDVAVIGARHEYTANSSSVAYVYERCGSLWSFAQQLAPPDGALGVDFGAAVAVNGTQIAIGEPNAAGPDAFRSGAVQLYSRQGSTWLPEQRIGNPSLENQTLYRFGAALALHHHLLLVSFSDPSPFSFAGFNTLFDVNSGARFLAALSGSNSLTVQISGHQALLNPYGRRIGTDPDVFDLPQ